jgi:small-conductance mechanosensitive channel
MSENTDATLEGELTAIMPGSAPLANLKAIHNGGATYVVLSARNGSATLQKVNLAGPSCTCGDMEYNQEDQQVCAHIVRAALDAPERLSAEEQAAWTLMNQAETLHDLTDRVRETAQEAEQSLVSVRDLEAQETGQTAEDPPEQVQNRSEPAEPDVNAEQAVRDWLDEHYSQPQLVQTMAGDHGSESGVRLEPDNQTMADHEYEAFKSLVNGVEESTVHVGFTEDGCSSCNSGAGGFFYHIPEVAARRL